MKKVFLFILCYILLNSSTCFALEDNLIPNARSGMLIEAGSGKIIYEKNINERVSVASMTKMVAQIIILEEIENGNIKWSDIVTVSKNAADMGGSQIYISEGENISVEDLMKGISMASGNDATVAMAEYISGTEEKFVKRMNKKVKELGLKDTHFVNCTGLDEENHYSSAHDMAYIAMDLVNNHSDILKFSSLYEDYLREDTDNKFWLVNTNKIIRNYSGADGLKTGHTDNAKYCLAVTAKKNNIRLIGIVLGEENSKIRNSESMSLLDYGFNNLKSKVLLKKDSVVKKVTLEKADKSLFNVYLKDDLVVVSDVDNNKNNYSYDIKLNNIKLPLRKNDIVGKINSISNGKIISSGKLIVKDNVSSIGLFNLYIRGVTDMFTGNL